MKNRQLIALIWAVLLLVPSTGEFEDRLRAVLREVMDSMVRSSYLLMSYTLLALARHKGRWMLGICSNQCWHAGTALHWGNYDEYRKYIEKDAALERRFQQVFVAQPTVETTISILRGLKQRYEVHHSVKITDSALVAADLSNRYISDRLPDKAIDG